MTKAGIEELELSWQSQPSKSGEASFSMPHLVHGAQGPTTIDHIAAPLWFYALQDEGENMEILESGNRDGIARAHRDLILTKNTPGGPPWLFGAIPFRFPAAVELRGCTAIGDAVVEAREYKSPAVQRSCAYSLVPISMQRRVWFLQAGRRRLRLQSRNKENDEGKDCALKSSQPIN